MTVSIVDWGQSCIELPFKIRGREGGGGGREGGREGGTLQLSMYTPHCIWNINDDIFTVVTIGFDPAVYLVNESSSSVDIVVTVREGQLGRPVQVSFAPTQPFNCKLPI